MGRRMRKMRGRIGRMNKMKRIGTSSPRSNSSGKRRHVIDPKNPRSSFVDHMIEDDLERLDTAVEGRNVKGVCILDTGDAVKHKRLLECDVKRLSVFIQQPHQRRDVRIKAWDGSRCK